jgi:hypothetical protein
MRTDVSSLDARGFTYFIGDTSCGCTVSPGMTNGCDACQCAATHYCDTGETTGATHDDAGCH